MRIRFTLATTLPRPDRSVFTADILQTMAAEVVGTPVDIDGLVVVVTQAYVEGRCGSVDLGGPPICYAALVVEAEP